MITSMREHRGYVYLGGIANNRIGRYSFKVLIRISSNTARWGRLT
jgi:ribose transport system permease protein